MTQWTMVNARGNYLDWCWQRSVTTMSEMSLFTEVIMRARLYGWNSPLALSSSGTERALKTTVLCRQACDMESHRRTSSGGLTSTATSYGWLGTGGKFFFVGGDGYLCPTTRMTLSALRRVAVCDILLVSFIAWAKSQDSVHKPFFFFLLKRKDSRSGSNRGPSAYQPSASPLGHTGLQSRRGSETKFRPTDSAVGQSVNQSVS